MTLSGLLSARLSKQIFHPRDQNFLAGRVEKVADHFPLLRQEQLWDGFHLISLAQIPIHIAIDLADDDFPAQFRCNLVNYG